MNNYFKINFKSCRIALIGAISCIATFGSKCVTITSLAGAPVSIPVESVEGVISVEELTRVYAGLVGQYPESIRILCETRELRPSHLVEPGTCLQAVVDRLGHSVAESLAPLTQRILDLQLPDYTGYTIFISFATRA